MRVLQALAVAGLTALAVLCVSGPAVQAQPTASSVSLPPGHGGGSAVERITLIVIAVLAVGAFVVLQRHRVVAAASLVGLCRLADLAARLRPLGRPR